MTRSAPRIQRMPAGNRQEFEERAAGPESNISIKGYGGWVARRLRSIDSGWRGFYSYSYTALPGFRHAKETGRARILGQIDGGKMEADIVRNEEERYPDLCTEKQRPSDSYWDDWREELSLADRVVVNSEWSKKLLLDGRLHRAGQHRSAYL